MRFAPALAVALFVITLTLTATAPAQTPAKHSVWTTLGTMAGAIPDAHRSQPANLLTYGDQTLLIDCGDGTAEQLAKAGVPLGKIRTIFLTHLHFDHIGGLFALLSLRFQVITPGVVTIYGPPGTKRMIDALIAAMLPTAEIGLLGQPQRQPADTVQVIEIAAGQKIVLGDITVTNTPNTHYGFPEGSPEAAKYLSFSYRFDMPDRSIAFTGDTGPSAGVERLAHGAALLVSEIVDPDAAMATVIAASPNLPPPALAAIRLHMTQQHLTADQVGLLARTTGAKEVVLTHNGLSENGSQAAIAVIAKTFNGKIVAARDLDRF